MAFNAHNPKLIKSISKDVLESLYIWGFAKPDAKAILNECLKEIENAKWPEHIDKPN